MGRAPMTRWRRQVGTAGAHSSRYPHRHVEVYESVAAATSGAQQLVTSQIALPLAACNAVYATAGYEQSAQNFPWTPSRATASPPTAGRPSWRR